MSPLMIDEHRDPIGPCASQRGAAIWCHSSNRARSIYRAYKGSVFCKQPVLFELPHRLCNAAWRLAISGPLFKWINAATHQRGNPLEYSR